MQIAPTRRLRLVIPHADGAHVVVDREDLPGVEVTLVESESTTTAAARWCSEVGLHPWVVDCIVDQIDEGSLSGRTREAMVATPVPPHAWTMPRGWMWKRWSEVRPAVADGIVAVVGQRLAERAGERPVPPERSSWARPGWFEAARVWISDSLAAAGRPGLPTITPVRFWGISAVMRVDGAHGRCWFKAAAPVFRDEPAITVELERWSEGSTASVIAADVDRGWLLLDDVGTTEVSSEADTTSAIDLLVSLQRRSLVHRAGLAWAGCRRRPIGGLVDGVAAALDAEVTREAVPTDAPTQTRIVDGVTAAVAAVVDMPETLVHGDFHPGNAAATDHGIVLFDWSDACFAPPFIDVVTWTWWYTDDPDREEFVWRCFEAAWQREFGLDPLRLDRRAIQTVAAAFHLSSYVAVCEAVEPHRRADHIAGLIHFVDLLDRFCP